MNIRPSIDQSMLSGVAFDQNLEAGDGEHEQIDFRKLWTIIVRRKISMAATICAITLIALIAGLNLPKRYTATAEVLINPPNQNLVQIDAFDSSQIAESAFVDSQVGIMKSKALSLRVIESLNLKQSEEFNPFLEGKGGLLQYLNPLTLAKKIFGKPPKRLEDLSDEELLTPIINKLTDVTKIRRQGLTYIVAISATSESPARAAAIANAMVDMYLLDDFEWRMDALNKTNQFLDRQLAELRNAVSRGEIAIEAYRTENDIHDVSGLTLTQKQRSDLTEKLILAKANSAEKEARHAIVADILQAGNDLGSLSEVLASPTVEALREQQAELTRRRGELMPQLGFRHPTMVNLQAELRVLDTQVRHEIDRIVNSLENEVKVAKSRVASLERSLDALDREEVLTSTAKIELNELERETNANRTLYESLLEGSKKSIVAAESGSLEAIGRKISTATVPDSPSEPQLKLIVMVAMIGSSALAFLLAFVLEALDEGIITSRQLEATAGIKTLASIPMLKDEQIRQRTGKTWRKKRIHRYLVEQPDSAFAESFRLLRSNLIFSNPNTPPQTVLVSSAFPNEGKTTTSICLAISAAESGLNTLLIDADLRKPAIVKRLGLSREKTNGFSEVLCKSCPFDEAVYRHEKYNLSLLASGTKVSRSSDMLKAESIEDILIQARQSYDFIVVDSAPILPVVDSALLATHMDAIAFVVQWEKTPRGAVANAVRKLESGGTPITGGVMNLVNMKRGRVIAYGDDTFYSSYYGDYYAD